MNELGKLFSSLVLVGAGFLAASFVGPPEAVSRLARYLQPTGQASPDALGPLESAAASAVAESDWPALPALDPAAGVTVPAAATVTPTPAAVAAEQSPTAFTAPVAAQIGPSSWQGSAEPDLAGSWPQEPASAPPTDEWLTTETLPAATPQPAQVQRTLTPIPRGEAPPVPADVPAAPPAPADGAEPQQPTPDWPALGPAENVTEGFPAVGFGETDPYAARPAFDAENDPWNPLRLRPAGGELAPIERTAAPPASGGEHVLTDGDTLALLAERYLGDAARAQELFELNRDRLTHPDVLPIGMVLRTPATSLRTPASPLRTPATAFRTPDGQPPAPSSPAAAADAFPSLGRPIGFAALAASPGPTAFASQTTAARPVVDASLTPVGQVPSSGQRPLTPVVPGFEAPRAADPASDAVYARDAAWETGSW